jgi:hypothetical protein
LEELPGSFLKTKALTPFRPTPDGVIDYPDPEAVIK